MRRLDIGIASYMGPDRLRKAISCLEQKSKTDYRVFVIDNNSDEATRNVIREAKGRNDRIVPVFLDENTGYAGAVNRLQKMAETEYIAYCDNDAYVHTDGWDEIMASLLDRFHEIGIIFPGWGSYPIPRGPYEEVQWGVGAFWMMNRMVIPDIAAFFKDDGCFDTNLGHQEEADYCLRVRMAGWKCAMTKDVAVAHEGHATGTTTAANQERINRGIINWVNKWAAYFGGKNINYHSPNVIRWEDWPPNALYMEEWFKTVIGVHELNIAPEVRRIQGQEYDLCRVFRFKDFYRDRII